MVLAHVLHKFFMVVQEFVALKMRASELNLIDLRTVVLFLFYFFLINETNIDKGVISYAVLIEIITS